jgi:CHASE3 domain sensor protein
LRVGTAVALTVLAVLGIVGAWMLERSSQVTDQLVNHSSPALLEAVRLEAALVDQETGIRGYGLTGRRDYLQPYTQGLSDEQAAVSALRADIVGDADAQRQLDTVLTAAADWQRIAATPVAAAPPGHAATLAAHTAAAGETAFDSLRAATTTQQRHLQQERANATADLHRVSDARDIVFAAMIALIVVLTVLVFEGMRRGVTTPLGRLATDAEQVAAGDFDHPIAATGPADLRQLATGVEAMRRRLVDELAFADQARAQLHEQATDLRRSNGELEQFAYFASHDLQEPLRKVASFCQLLERRYADQLDERARQYIAFAVDGATRMQTLVNALLAFSQVGRSTRSAWRSTSPTR